MEMHELDMREASLPYFHHNLKSMLAESGFAILRGAVSEARIARYHQMLDDTYNRLNQYVKNQGVSIAPEDYAKPYNGKGGAHEIAFRLNLGQIPDKFFTVANPGFSMYDVIGDMRFGVLLMNFFQRPYFPSPAGHARRVSFDEEDKYKNFAGPIRLHVDATHHTPHQFGLNFWTPLGPCGETAPGLQLLVVGYREVVDFLKVDFGKSPRSKDDVYINQERINALEYNAFENFDEDLLYRPRMNVGDVLLFHNWSIHGTYKTPEMTEKRMSLELRVNCNSFTFPG